jgi:ComF family protein
MLSSYSRSAAIGLLTLPLRAAIDFALPPRCPACGLIVGADGSFCTECWSKLHFLGGPGCAACGMPFETDQGPDVRCGACLAEPPAHDGVRAAVAYGEVARILALKLKYGRRVGLARVIGGHVARRAGEERDALIVPVPLHRWRIWRRSFNQSALIGAEIARRLGLELRTDLIERRKATPMLGGLGRTARARTLRGAFAVPSEKKAVLQGRTVLLIDDVYTSGATANGCARVLKRAGAARVVVMCWARVLPGHVDADTALGDEGDRGD